MGIEYSRQNFRGQVAGTDIHPGIFIHLTAEKRLRLVPFSRMISARSV
jgi:hypothetical protein